MEGFKNRSALPRPNFSDVYRLLDPIDVYARYIPNLKINTVMRSPLGEVDNHPSFSVFWSVRKQKYMFKEHRYGWTGDCVDFVRYYFGYTNNFHACMRIMYDFNIEGFRIDPKIAETAPTAYAGVTKVVKRKENRFDLKVTVRDWKPYDFEFWGKYGITRKWLNAAGIHPISYYYFNTRTIRAEKYSYVYVENKDGVMTYKIYQPFSKHRKWVSNNNASVWELWNMLPQTHDFLIITKSRKDALCIMATCKIPAVALQAESTVPKEKVVREIKSRFKNVFLLYDNDFNSLKNWGQNHARKLAKTFDLRNIIIPDEYKSKDYTDFVVNHSIKEGVALIKKLINYDSKRES